MKAWMGRKLALRCYEGFMESPRTHFILPVGGFAGLPSGMDTVGCAVNLIFGQAAQRDGLSFTEGERTRRYAVAERDAIQINYGFLRGLESRKF